jgi:hypothetical protein
LLAAFHAAAAGIQASADIPPVAVLLDAASRSVYGTNVYAIIYENVKTLFLFGNGRRIVM